MERYRDNRNFMKSNFMEDILSDQNKQLPQPPLQKPYEDNAEIIELPKVDRDIIVKKDIHNCILDRKSNREYSKESLTIEELSYLLWATQGVKEIRGDNYAAVRPVASAGARHPYETYLAVKNIKGLKKGMYRYLALEHKLLFLYEEEAIEEKITDGTLGQKFASTAAVNFIWSCIPYRGEWRYDKLSHKVMLIDAGHICHALYIACEALGLGTCAIAAYDQGLMDEIVKVDGEDEFVVYMAPVGKL
ncbi:SagB/ThcOx family dehydrogenase [Tissierella sp.]|uniref:SagB/ThcOx family dehydrogenase n=1 Tax=Tissierella sp. TaxID=41274 RepID=UPI00285569FA|nr:SagB/ThcOx family dehydrogenase [Tissierella sp.]MDR7857830.1 SagB/ThcOx family dehydrogenase [Tissierella sp.]